MLRVKWLCEQRSMLSCGMVRGVIPSAQLNFTKQISIDVHSNAEVYVSDFPGVDVMVLQRMFGEQTVEICRRARMQHKIKVVYDIDDALWLLPSKSTGEDFDKFQLFFPEQATKEITQMMVNEVDYVTCSTIELAEELKRMGVLNVSVLENRVDPQLFAIPKTKKDKPTIDIVWYAACGHNSNAVLFDGIFDAIFSEFPNVRLHLIGAPQSFSNLQNMGRFGNKVVMHDWKLYTDLGRTIKEFDIAMCSVFDYPFTRCKSELKAIETAMSGLIPVMSKMPQYERFAKRVLKPEEMELLVPNETEAWVSTLRKLITKELVVDASDLQRRAILEYGVQKAVQEWGRFYHTVVA